MTIGGTRHAIYSPGAKSVRYRETITSGSESVFTPYPLSVLEGIIDGVVFVDRVDSPQCAAVMSSNFVGARLIGDAADETFNAEFVDTMKEHFFAGDLSSRKIHLFWSAASDSRDALIFNIFS
ncbi:hypothetical protein AAC03nite_33180 [Alicyclobacillus acidoterrestris]|uniref:hypothetical protein n=1 Tax=Alicyclobacillus suci TaxID=2816080 RepID=UPI001194037E|nr:hypothetical protein [Alicyclobacillus suci]GEO27533.1 hypothetical protein AAC03nite_33180 [Alicyclobacillus acidoterrestris]